MESGKEYTGYDLGITPEKAHKLMRACFITPNKDKRSLPLSKKRKW